MFFERPESGTRALLIHIEQEESDAAELWELTVSAGLEPVSCMTARRRYPDPKTYIGSGKLDEIHSEADRCEAEIVLFDQELSPAQERNLERILNRRSR